MKIGLINVDSKIPNLALMKISAWHKRQGDSVSIYSPLFKYDKVYGSKIFTDSKYNYNSQPITWGGSGVSIETKLPIEIEHIYPDYSLFNCSYAMGYLTRGCINKCPFCIVWKKEGFLHRNARLDEFRKDQKEVMLLDNAITDYFYILGDLLQIRDLGIRLNLTQGFNVRTITPEFAKVLSEIKLWKGKQWHISWDYPKDEKEVLKGIKTLNQAGIKNWKIMCYVLVGYNTSRKEDLHRIDTLEKMGVDPFVMPYVKTDYTLKLARWCNRKQIFKSCSFNEYLKKGIDG